MTMKPIKLLIACFFVVLLIPLVSHADDSDVYDISQNVKPNVLIIFDNSGSMGNGAPYVDTEDYCVDYGSCTYDTDTIYQRGSCISWDDVDLDGVYDSGETCYEWSWVEYTGTFTDTNLDGRHDSNSSIRRGNRLNYENLPTSSLRKINIARDATKQVIEDNWQYFRLGIMLLNGDLTLSNTGYHSDTSILSTSNGGVPIMDMDDETDVTTLKGYIDAQSANGYTPLANRLINAAQYFKHEDSTTFGNFGANGGFADPIDATYWCRKNYVIIVTDGLPTAEGDTRSDSDDVAGEFDYIENFLPTDDYDNDGNDPNGAAYEQGGSDYLDDVAKYLYETDLRPTIEGNQNITTFTIGFDIVHTLLEDTAQNGGGDYYTAYTPADLERALMSVVATILDRAQTFTAPVVPVQRTTSGDKMYISLFTPQTTVNFWPGYLVKLKIGSNGELIGFSDGYGGSTEIQVTDSNGLLHEDLLRSDRSPYPYWDAHQMLKDRNFGTNPRNIYTYLGTSNQLSDSSNEFNDSNVSDVMLGTPTKQANAETGPTAVQDLINYIYGIDAYDADLDNDYAEKKEDIMGDILHSQPLVVDYASDPANPQRLIYVGTNEGMLHAFDDTDGSEKWAFIPPDLLPRLKNIIEGAGHQYYVDGSPKAYILDHDGDGNIETPDQDTNYDKVIIIFGERRGGNTYTAVDVTNPDDPRYLWSIDNTVVGLEELGQSWSDPVIGKVKAGPVGSETDTIVAFIGGGYDSVNPEPSNNTIGRGFFIIDVLSGALIKSFTVTDHADIVYSIPSTVLAVDTTFDTYINRVYVGDLGGQMWRFGNQTGAENGNVNNWTPRKLFASTVADAKIFYPPDMVLEWGYAYLYFGTGDRANPMATTGTNMLYAVKDKNVVGSFTTIRDDDADFYDLTDDLLQDSGTTEAEKQTIREQLANGNGWYITLANSEKVLAPVTVIYKVVLFTTFLPVDTVTDPCSYGGDARLYALDYLTAVSVIDFNADNNLDASDRSIEIGQGIPTEVVITINDAGKTTAYIGAGGGIVRFDLSGIGRKFYIDAWHEEF
jgi:type IV pilus assembly protein PilY1